MFSMVRNSQYESFRQGRIVTMHAFKVYSKYLTQSNAMLTISVMEIQHKEIVL